MCIRDRYLHRASQSFLLYAVKKCRTVISMRNMKVIVWYAKDVYKRQAVKGFGKKIQAQKITLSLEPGKNNTPEMPDAVKPVQSTVTLDLNKDLQLEACLLYTSRCV